MQIVVRYKSCCANFAVLYFWLFNLKLRSDIIPNLKRKNKQHLVEVQSKAKEVIMMALAKVFAAIFCFGSAAVDVAGVSLLQLQPSNFLFEPTFKLGQKVKVRVCQNII